MVTKIWPEKKAMPFMLATIVCLSITWWHDYDDDDDDGFPSVMSLSSSYNHKIKKLLTGLSIYKPIDNIHQPTYIKASGKIWFNYLDLCMHTNNPLVDQIDDQ